MEVGSSVFKLVRDVKCDEELYTSKSSGNNEVAIHESLP